MHYGIVSCIPTLVLIIGVLSTKRMTESLFVSALLGAVLVYRTSFLSGFESLIYGALSNDSFQLLAIVAVCFGGIIALLEKSGAMLGFRELLGKFCTNAKRTMALTWLLGGLVFIDDYLNALAVSVSMKDISDRYKIPREHLAYTVNCMGACICVLIPVSSWSAFAMSDLKAYGLGAQDYFRAIPFMFYPISAVLICLLFAYRKIPALGAMKKAYRRVAQGGSVEPKGTVTANAAEFNQKAAPKKPSSVLLFLIPMACLFIGMMCFHNDIIIGIFFSVGSMLLLFCAGKKMKITEFVDTFVQSAAGMAPLLINILLAFMLQGANEQMGFANYVIGLFTRSVSPSLLPLLAFLIVGGTAFLAASFWALIIITFPIFLPLASSMGVNPSLVIGAIMSGVALGSQACLYSDAVFMVASGTGVPNDVQFQSVLPYVGIGAAIAAVCFTVAGFI